MMKFKIAMALIGILLLTACHDDHREKQLRQKALEFADAFYNYQFDKCLAYCTPEAKSWIRFAASNVHESDVQTLRSQKVGASVKLDDICLEEGDTLAIVHLTVSDFMTLDSIGKAGKIIRKATVALPAIYREKKWLINLQRIPEITNETK